MDTTTNTEKKPTITTTYEFPRNSRIRHFLRYEYLINEIDARLASRQGYAIVEALRLLHQLIEINMNNDMRGEVMRNLNQQCHQLLQFKDRAEVNQTHLQKELEEKKQVMQEIEKVAIPTAMYHNHYLLSTIKSYLNISGGLANFHLPMFATWTTLPHNHQQQNLRDWYAPFKELYNGIQSSLAMTRESAEFKPHQAEAGFYTENIPPSIKCELIRLSVKRDIFPKLSVNSSRLLVHFFRTTDFQKAPEQSKASIDFKIALCNL
ncbi:MAG: cell division protein ZapD [Chromatiales bacterium]|nr:cell division protein ZapD [Chromatiales bacterium]